VTGSADLYRFKALLLPWTVRGLSTFELNGTAWHDGDTFAALIDKGMRGYDLFHVRAAGYDAPEVTGPTKPAGDAATAYARSLAETGEIVYLDSLAFAASAEEDNFGRMLAFVTLPNGTDLAALMINSGHAVPDPV
jgi:endonuclease YncB( thermonuclease family)